MEAVASAVEQFLATHNRCVVLCDDVTKYCSTALATAFMLHSFSLISRHWGLSPGTVLLPLSGQPRTLTR